MKNYTKFYCYEYENNEGGLSYKSFDIPIKEYVDEGHNIQNPDWCIFLSKQERDLDLAQFLKDTYTHE